jgi:hypothetical protein
MVSDRVVAGIIVVRNFPALRQRQIRRLAAKRAAGRSCAVESGEKFSTIRNLEIVWYIRRRAIWKSSNKTS